MKLLADTSALLALVIRDDRHHAAAVSFARANPTTRFLVSDLIVAEIATRLRALSDARRAVHAVRSILTSPRYDVVYVDAAIVDAALERMERFDDKRLSLADCASFVLMDRLALSAAFSFDRDFRDCGYATTP